MSLPKAALAATHRTAFALRFAASARTWEPARPEPRPDMRRLVVSGFFNETLGIGSAGALTAAALRSAGCEVVTEDVRPLHRGLLTGKPVNMPDMARVWLIHANPPEARIALFRHRYASWAELYRIGYWAWESSEAPADWAKTARWFHEIWVPSGHVADALTAAFDRGGMANEAHKLRIMPHPVAFQPAPQPHAGVRALTLFDPRSDLDRKNPAGAIEAWLMAFPKPRPDASLLVKTLDNFGHHPQLAALKARSAGRGDIAFMSEDLSYTQTLDLIANSDIVLSLHRAEGFGLPLAEAMAAGVCVIATGWSGNMQFMTPGNSLPIAYKLARANRRHNGPSAQWADPDIAAAAEALREAAGDANLRGRLGRQARIDIARLGEAWTAAELFPPR